MWTYTLTHICEEPEQLSPSVGEPKLARWTGSHPEPSSLRRGPGFFLWWPRGSWSASSLGCKAPTTAQSFKGLWAFSSELLWKCPTVFFLLLVQLLSYVRLFVTPWTAAHQASLSFTISQSLLKLMSIVKLVLPSNHLILCHFLLLLPSVFPSIKVFSNESACCIRWPKVLELQL